LWSVPKNATQILHIQHNLFDIVIWRCAASFHRNPLTIHVERLELFMDHKNFRQTWCGHRVQAAVVLVVGELMRGVDGELDIIYRSAINRCLGQFIPITCGCTQVSINALWLLAICNLQFMMILFCVHSISSEEKSWEVIWRSIVAFVSILMCIFFMVLLFLMATLLVIRGIFGCLLLLQSWFLRRTKLSRFMLMLWSLYLQFCCYFCLSYVCDGKIWSHFWSLWLSIDSHQQLLTNHCLHLWYHGYFH